MSGETLYLLDQGPTLNGGGYYLDVEIARPLYRTVRVEGEVTAIKRLTSPTHLRALGRKRAKGPGPVDGYLITGRHAA